MIVMAERIYRYFFPCGESAKKASERTNQELDAFMLWIQERRLELELKRHGKRGERLSKTGE